MPYPGNPSPKNLSPNQTTVGGSFSFTYYLGIDPGVSGGLALITPDQVIASPMPTTERDMYDWFSTYIEFPEHTWGVIELVGGFISSRGASRQPGSRMFTFGQNYGGLRMCMVAHGIRFEQVHPRRWQKSFGMMRKPKEVDTAWKNRLKALAQQLYPQLRITKQVADAILLASYAASTR